MGPEARLERLLNQVKKKYKINAQFKIKISKKVKTTKHDPYMEILFLKTPTINVYINKFLTRFEKIPDNSLKRILVHELIHFVIHEGVKSKNIKQLRNALRLVDRMIDGC